jgi:hypothetical protein
MTTVAAKKTATRAPRKTAAKKAVTAPQTSETASKVVTPVAEPAAASAAPSVGPVKLDRLTPRALENLTELAKEGNTNTSRKHWIGVLAQYGVTVPFVPVAE